MKPYYEDATSTIYHGDCRAVLPELPTAVADLLFTDPPYAAALATVTTGFAREKWGANWGDLSIAAMLAEMVIDQPALLHGHQVLWFCDHLSYAAILPSFFRRYRLVQNIVWDKDVLGAGSGFRKQTEFILYAQRGLIEAPIGNSARDLIRLRPRYSDKEHPAAKPLPLLILLASHLRWNTALDPFMGSGTTLVAAKAMGRKAIGIEIEERYCEIAATRLSQEVLPLEVTA